MLRLRKVWHRDSLGTRFEIHQQKRADGSKSRIAVILKQTSTFKRAKMQKLRIAQISNLVTPITDSSTNGLAQIVYNLTQELVDLGHDVTLYAPLNSSTNARLVPLSSLPNASETILGKVLPVAAAFSDWRHFDIIHDHTRFYSTLSAHLVQIPVVSTVHHPVELDELHWHHLRLLIRAPPPPLWQSISVSWMNSSNR
jgi:hypothetical protein